MSKYMFAAAQCDITVASSGPIKVDERTIIAPTLSRRETPEANKVHSTPAIVDEARTLPKWETGRPEEEKVKLLKDGGYRGIDRYEEVGGAHVREKARRLGQERQRVHLEHTEQELQLQQEYQEEQNSITELANQAAEARRIELESYLEAKKTQRELEATELDPNATQQDTRPRVHPIDILQGQIAADLEAERQSEVCDLFFFPSFFSVLERVLGILESDPVWRFFWSIFFFFFALRAKTPVTSSPLPLFFISGI